MSPSKACVALVMLLAAASFASSQEIADQAPAPATPVAEKRPWWQRGRRAGEL